MDNEHKVKKAAELLALVESLAAPTLRVAGCPTCEEAAKRGDNYGPGHSASPNCKSGGRPHCTCDTCY